MIKSFLRKNQNLKFGAYDFKNSDKFKFLMKPKKGRKSYKISLRRCKGVSKHDLEMPSDVPVFGVGVFDDILLIRLVDVIKDVKKN